MDTETIVTDFIGSIVVGFIITFLSGIAYISVGSQSPYINEGGIPLTWIAKEEFLGTTSYEYTGFILDMIFWAFFIFLIIYWNQKARINIEKKSSEPSEDNKPETIREKQLKLVQKIQEERQAEKLFEEARKMKKKDKKK